MNTWLEVVTFHARPGVSDADMLAAAARASDFLASLDGFISRRLTRGGDGQWVDHVEWQSLSAAEAAAASFPDSADAGAFMALIAEGAQMDHLEIVHVC